MQLDPQLRKNTQSRRRVLRLAAVGGIAVASSCQRPSASTGTLEKVWGQRGIVDGEFQKPRAIAIDQDDLLYIVDMTGRIQVFDVEGVHQRTWRTPSIKFGKPCGLSFDREGNLMVADTHYYQILFYNRAGKLLRNRTIGGKHGDAIGEFSFVTDAAQDSQGNYYVAQYHEHDRIQKFSSDGKFQLRWGKLGEGPAEFNRPQNLVMDESDRLWVADSCNHRVQVFDTRATTPELVTTWGTAGTGPGELKYPYDIVLDRRGHVYLCEFGNHRVQKFTLDGKWLAAWGQPGRREGELHNPWGCARDSSGRLHVLDSMNHRIQRIAL